MIPTLDPYQGHTFPLHEHTMDISGWRQLYDNSTANYASGRASQGAELLHTKRQKSCYMKGL